MQKVKLEEMELTVFEKVMKDGGVFFDVGAQMNFEDYYEKNKICEYHLFEPNPYYHKKLQDSVSRAKNEISNSKIYLNNLALSDFESDENDYWAEADCIENLNRGHLADFKIKVSTLSKYIKQNNIEKIQFIKTDCEGSDYKIISGSYETILEMQIPFIQVEYWTDYPNRIYEFNDLLKEHYNLFVLNCSLLAQYSGYQDSIMPLTDTLLQDIHDRWIPSGWGANILAVHKKVKFDYTEFLYKIQ